MTNWSDRTIRWKVPLGVVHSQNDGNQNRKSRSTEYALSSLPIEAQLKFLKQPLIQGPDCTALVLRSDPNQSKLFASLPEVTGPQRLNFSAEQNAQAMKRLEAIAPLLEFSNRSKRSRPTFRTADTPRPTMYSNSVASNEATFCSFAAVSTAPANGCSDKFSTKARRETRELCGCSSPHPFDGVPGIAANSTLSLIQLKDETGEFYDLREKRLDITSYYLALAGGTMPFIRRYSTI